jgi:lipoprotein-releasing system ATP-binding protein
MLETKGLQYSYSALKKFTFPDIVCRDSESLLILGQSGRGKTTLLHLLALLLTPETGSIRIGSEEVTSLPPRSLAQLRANQIGIIYQKAHFVNALSVKANLLISNYLAEKKPDVARASYLAEQLGFAEHLGKKTFQLSQGEQQRVSIARALMNAPSVILADEPTSNLDDVNCDRVVRLLKEQSSQIGASLIVVTHDQRLKDTFKDRIIL